MTTIFAEAVKEAVMAESSGDDLLTPRDAAAYLQQKWGRPFSAKDFMNFRQNAQRRAKEAGKPLSEFFPIEPAYTDRYVSMWKRSDLDILVEKIPPPKYRKELYGRNYRTKKDA